jgi:hypothetical protein
MFNRLPRAIFWGEGRLRLPNAQSNSRINALPVVAIAKNW